MNIEYDEEESIYIGKSCYAIYNNDKKYFFSSRLIVCTWMQIVT